MNVHIQRARVAMDIRRWDVAHEMLVRGLAEDPQNGILYAMQAEVFYRENKYQEALSAAVECIARKPKWSHGYFWLAWCLLAENPLSPETLQKATLVAEEALACNPDDPSNYDLRAEVARMAGNPLEALRLCRAGLALAPEHENLWLTVGRAQMDLKRYDDAELSVRGLLACEPNSALAHHCLGQIALFTHRYEEAYDYSAIALRNDPDLCQAQGVHSLAMHFLEPAVGFSRLPKNFTWIETWLWVRFFISAILVLVSPMISETCHSIASIGFLLVVATMMSGVLSKFFAETATGLVGLFCQRAKGSSNKL